MEENKNQNADLWDDGAYGTGRTKPPKTHSGIVALLLVIVIFMTGIITVLGLLNVRLFKELNTQGKEEDTLSISFVEEQPEDPSAPSGPEQGQQTFCQDTTIQLEDTPKSVATMPEGGGISLQEIYEKNIPSVVSIRVRVPGGGSTGTGVILSEEGYIVTNSHVVQDAASITVQLTDDRILPAHLVGEDPVSDLAVLYIEAEDLTAAAFGDSGALRVGDTVAAIGDPLGVDLRGTMTDGIVSAINRDVTLGGRTLTLIQTNAALNSGNSGGPLLNCYGQVIGINTMKIGTFANKSGVEGLGFAIPSTTVKEIVDQIIAKGYVSGRPTLGIRGESLSAFYQHYYRLPPGLFITEIQPDSPAETAGLIPGNILMTIDGHPILSYQDLTEILYHYNVGDSVTAVIYAGGSQQKITLTLTEYRG